MIYIKNYIFIMAQYIFDGLIGLVVSDSKFDNEKIPYYHISFIRANINTTHTSNTKLSAPVVCGLILR